MRQVCLKSVLLGVVGLLFIAAKPQATRGDDWAQWGGPNRDLVWREKGIVEKFPTSGLLPRVWTTPLGEGYTGPAVANGKVYVTDFVREVANRGQERVLCLDAQSGAVLWKHEYPANYTVSYPFGPRATPLIDEGRVYTIGAMGNMFCFDAQTGAMYWEKSFVKDYGTDLPTWGMAACPLVDGNQLITLVGGANGGTVISFDKVTGKEIWRAIDDPLVGYCPPVIFTFGNVRQLIIWHPEAITSLEPQTGKKYWSVPFFLGKQSLAIPTPRQFENKLFVTSFYDGPLMLEVAADGMSAKVLWKAPARNEINTTHLNAIMCTPWLTKTHIYGVCSYGQLRCLEAETGHRVWETREATGNARWWNAFLIPHEDRFFIHNEQGDLIIAKLSPAGYEELSRAKLIEPTRDVNRRLTIWSHPAFAMQSVFARNDKEIVRVNLAK